MTWITGSLDCGHDFACDCDDYRDDRIAGAWHDIDEAQTLQHKRGVRERATDRPTSSPVAGPVTTGQRTTPARVRALHPVPPTTRDERLARDVLYPVGDVIALPVNPPIKDDGAGADFPGAA